MLILEYISTHGTPEWCAARMSGFQVGQDMFDTGG